MNVTDVITASSGRMDVVGLTCVYPPVGFEVGTLGVNFFTAFIVTHVDSSPLNVW